MREVIIKAVDLCKSFANDGIQNHVLDHVDLEIYKEDFTVIMGASGAGKSTLLYCLSAMDKITSGKIIYNGNEIQGMKEKDYTRLRSKEFGFIFQQIHLVSNLTLFENVAVPGYLNKQKKQSMVDEAAKALLEDVNLTEAMNRLPSQVSGGEQQRAVVARAIINNPALLFADEPTGALNRKNTMDVLDLLTELHNQGQSIVMVTHDIKAALRADRVLYLSDGSIQGELTLPPYSYEERKSREVQLNAWLSSMEW